MNGPRIGSLCSGYGGLEEGVRSVLGGHVVWQSEIDPGACKILGHRYPGVPNIGDMTAVDWSQVEPVDVLCGGTPCQDLSAAGKRQGMTEGTRSNLWVAMREAIAQLRPSLVVWENVRGAYSARADSELESREGRVGVLGDGPVLRALGRVLGDLSSLGFDAEWVGLRAADVGAPHGRFRVFVVAWPAGADAVELGRRPARGDDGVRAARLVTGTAPPDASCLGWSEPAGVREDRGAGRALARSEAVGAPAQDTDGAARCERRQPAPGQAEGGRSRADAGRRGGAPAAHPQGNGRHEGRPEPARLLGGSDAALGGDAPAHPDRDAVREQPVALAGRGSKAVAGLAGADAAANPSHRPGKRERTRPEPRTGSPAASDPDGDRREVVERVEPRLGARGDAHGRGQVDWGAYGPAVERWERLTRPAPAPTEPSKRGQPRLSPAFVEWLMGLPAGWVTDVPGLTCNEQLKALGNGVVPQQAAAALRLLLPDVGEVAA